MSKLYPPYVESTIPAQAAATEGGRVLKIPFRLNRAVSLASVAKVCARIKTVSTNSWLGEAVVENELTNVYFNSVGADYYFVEFNEEALKDIKLSVGQYYKIQLAFIDANGVVGYYSSVGVFKYTAKPTIYIEGLSGEETKNNGNLYTYIGVYDQSGEGQDPTEKVYSYRFDLREGEVIVATSGVQLHDSTQDEKPQESRDVWVINQQLRDGVQYTIQYSVITLNDYEDSTPAYNIVNSEFDYEDDNSIKQYLKFENNFENGYVRLFFNSQINVKGGGFVISRASSEDNYETWYDVMRFTLGGSGTSFPDEFFKDFSVVQGVSYKYALQRYNDSGLYTTRLLFSSIEDDSTTAYADFEDMFLYDGIRQLKVRFNPKVTSFKTTVLESKTNTIGGKYPFIFRNGNVRYKEFSISGLISYLADADELFMSNMELGFVEQYAQRTSTPHNETLRSLTRSAHVDTVNMAAERAFKLQVLEWLTNGKPKLFRSPGEGNYIVNLMNVSLSPNDTVARMLHTFSCQACEIADCNFDNLKKYGFIEDKQINNEVLIFESIPLQNVAMRTNCLDGYGKYGGVYYAEFRNATPGAIFTLRFTNGKGDLQIAIPHNGSYFVHIFNEPLVSVTANQKDLTGWLDIGYYGQSGVAGDFCAIRKIAIGNQDYFQYGCVLEGGNIISNYLEDTKFKAGYFYILRAGMRYSNTTLYVSSNPNDNKYYEDVDLEMEFKNIESECIYPLKDVNGTVIAYLDGYSKTRSMTPPEYWIKIQVRGSKEIELINLRGYDQYDFPSCYVDYLEISSGIKLECHYMEQELIYAVEEDNEHVKDLREAWILSGAPREGAVYENLITAIETELKKQQ